MKKENKFSDLKLSIALYGIMLIILLAFFILLNKATSSGFGIREIIFSIIAALLATSFLVWDKNFMKNRPYLGLLIGFSTLALVEYGLVFRFRGPFTTTFIVISSLVVALYLLIFFFKYRRQEQISIDSEFDDEL